MKRLFIYILLLSTLTACKEDMLEDIMHAGDSEVIHIDGIDLSDAISITSEVSSRATTMKGVDAETIDWLLTPLKAGLDITYGKVASTPADQEESVAILRLEDSDGAGGEDYDIEDDYAKYTFNLRGSDGKRTDTPAKWHGNGPHYFEGLYVPQEIRYTSDVNEINVSGKAPDLASDQSGENYTLLSHYLGMAANTRLSATIERVKLPFRHRLAHVMAFILIDPVLGGAKIEGYKGEKHDQSVEDPKTSSIYFRNVKVLRGVKDIYDSSKELHTLTPLWGEKEARVTPHFIDEMGSLDAEKKPRKLADDSSVSYADNFVMYINNDMTTTSDNANIYPSSDKWPAANTAWTNKYNAASGDDTAKRNAANSNSGYTRVEYGKVPVYDLIVRPTYKSKDDVMYDEDLTSSTGVDEDKKKENFAALTNQIDFDITLDNGLQYTKEFEFDLDANHETVVYLRISREGVDYNDSGSALWIIDEKYDGYYGLNNKNGNTLSKAGSSWQRAYTYGYQVSETPGTTTGVTDGQFYNVSNSHEENENAQYFTEDYKTQWIEKFLQAYKEGKHHGDYFALKTNITIDATLIPKDFIFTGHLDAQDHTIELTNCGQPVYKSAESLEGLFTESSGAYTSYNVPEHLYEKVDIPAELYTYREYILQDGKEETTEGEFDALSDAEKTKIPAQTTYSEVTVTLDILLHRTGLYTDNEGHNPFANPAALYQVSHTSASYLFAGLNGNYTTVQENNSSATVWEANVHKETNDYGSKSHWVPTMGYRAETLNVKMQSPTILFKAEAEITGNVQNCWNGDTRIPNVTPALPNYK